MLNIGRKAGERIYLTLPDGTRCTILVIQARGNVRLGLEFPKSVKIERDDAVKREGRQDA